MLERMDPKRLPCTTLTRPALMAFTVTIISTAFPKVAFKSPPIICPVWAARASVEPPKMAAKGTIATKLHVKRAAALQ